jgi:3-dehydroquinate dehydratase
MPLVRFVIVMEIPYITTTNQRGPTTYGTTTINNVNTRMRDDTTTTNNVSMRVRDDTTVTNNVSTRVKVNAITSTWGLAP